MSNTIKISYIHNLRMFFFLNIQDFDDGNFGISFNLIFSEYFVAFFVIDHQDLHCS